MKKQQIKRVYREYFELIGLGVNDFKNFLKDAWEASVTGSVSFAITNFPNKYKWEALFRFGEINGFVEKAIKCKSFEDFENYFLSRI